MTPVTDMSSVLFFFFFFQMLTTVLVPIENLVAFVSFGCQIIVQIMSLTAALNITLLAGIKAAVGQRTERKFPS